MVELTATWAHKPHVLLVFNHFARAWLSPVQSDSLLQTTHHNPLTQHSVHIDMLPFLKRDTDEILNMARVSRGQRCLT